METVITRGIVPRVGFYGATVGRSETSNFGQKALWLVKTAAEIGIRSGPPQAEEGPSRFWPAKEEDRLVDAIAQETSAMWREQFPRYELPFGYGDASYWELENC